MKNPNAIELTHGKRILLGVAALATIAIPLLAGIPAGQAIAADGKNSAAPAPVTAGKIELLANRRVKLQYENVDVRSLLQAMAQAANVNMLVSDRVSGTVTVRLEAMPWEQALDVVLASQGLGRREKAGIIVVEPLPRT